MSSNLIIKTQSTQEDGQVPECDVGVCLNNRLSLIVSVRTKRQRCFDNTSEIASHPSVNSRRNPSRNVMEAFLRLNISFLEIPLHSVRFIRAPSAKITVSKTESFLPSTKSSETRPKFDKIIPARAPTRSGMEKSSQRGGLLFVIFRISRISSI